MRVDVRVIGRLVNPAGDGRAKRDNKTPEQERHGPPRQAPYSHWPQVSTRQKRLFTMLLWLILFSFVESVTSKFSYPSVGRYGICHAHMPFS
jgi:hypothetical protein